MKTKLIWDDAKRIANLAKHGLDFADAGEVLASRYRLDITVVRHGELRIQSISYALGFLAVLTAVHTARDGATRMISFRPASTLFQFQINPIGRCFALPCYSTVCGFAPTLGLIWKRN